MKRALIILTILFSLFSFSSFKEEKVSARVLKSFKTTFKSATDVDWSVTEKFYKANFLMNGQYVTAYYKGSGALVALTRNISSTQLPVSLQTSLKSHQENCWISDLFEVANEEGTTYYVTLENAEAKVVLQSLASDWIPFQKKYKS